MALPTERTWLDGDDLDTTNLNAGVRDVLTFLMARPAAHLRQTAAQSLTNNTWTSLTFTTGEDLDSHNGHDTASNTSRYVAQEDGWYQCSGGYGAAANSTGNRWVRWAKNGTEVNGSGCDMVTIPSAAGAAVLATRTILLSMSAGDYVEIQGLQTSGGALNTSVVTWEQSSMTVVWTRRL